MSHRFRVSRRREDQKGGPKKKHLKELGNALEKLDILIQAV